MKIIDLLNKIANGEEVPKIIKYKGWYFKCYKGSPIKYHVDFDVCSKPLCDYYNDTELNDEIEIIGNKFDKEE